MGNGTCRCRDQDRLIRNRHCPEVVPMQTFSLELPGPSAIDTDGQSTGGSRKNQP